MKYLLLLSVLIFPSFSYASTVSYTAGNVVNPLQFTVNLTDVNDLESDILTTSTYFCLEFWNSTTGYGKSDNGFLISSLTNNSSYNFTATLAEGEYTTIAYSGSGSSECSSINSGGVYAVGNDIDTIFTVIPAENPTVSPLSVNSYDDEITITGVPSGSCFAVYLPNTTEAQNYYAYTEACYGDTVLPWGCATNDVSCNSIVGDINADDEFSGAWRFVLTNDNNAFCENSTYSDCVSSGSYGGTQFSVNVNYNLGGGGGGGGAGISFLKETVTPLDLVASVQSGAQETGKGTLPLIALVGIPIAFLILLGLVNLIKQTVDTPKRGGRRTINPGGEDFIEHSADDLEFKRNYGKSKP